MKVSENGDQLAVGLSTDLIQMWNLNDIIVEQSTNGDNHCDGYGPEGESGQQQQHQHSLVVVPPVSTLPGKLVSFAPGGIMATSGKDGYIQLQDTINSNR